MGPARGGYDAPRPAPRRRCSGSALLVAVFLLLVLAGLAGHLVTVTGVQHTTTMLAVQGSRAQFAARAGLEWAIGDIVHNAGTGIDCSAGTTALDLTEGALDGFRVEVLCTAVPVTEGAAGYTLYNLESTATLGPAGRPDFVRRTLQAAVAL